MQSPVKRGSVYYGWKLLGVIWLIYALTATAPSYGANVIFSRMVNEGLINEDILGITTTIRFTALMLMPIPTSIFMNKLGLRFTVTLGAVISALASLLYFLFDMPAWLYLIVFFVFGGSAILDGIITGPNFVNEWFEQRKPFAQSIMMTSGAIGGMVLPIILGALCRYGGWRSGWLLFFIMGTFAAILSAAFIRNRPEDIGEIKDGRAWNQRHGRTQDTNYKAAKTNDPAPVGKLIRSREFVILSIMLFCNRIVFAGGISYLIIHAMQRGLSLESATFCLAVFNGAALVGRFAPAITDNVPIPIHVEYGASYAVMACGAIIIAFATGQNLFFIGCLVIGFGWGYSFAFFAVVLPKYFGSANFSAVFGIMNTLGYIGGAASPVLFMMAVKATSSYTVSYAAVGMASLICVILALCIPPRPEKFEHIYMDK